MNAPVTDTTVAAVAQTLFHFLWQAVVVWAIVESLVRIVTPRRAQTRYAVYCAMLLVLAVCPVVTFVVITGGANEVPSVGYWQLASIEERDAALAVFSSAESNQAETAASWLPTTSGVQTWIDRHRLAIALLWLVGVVGFGTRLATGSVWAWTIARRGEALPASWSDRVERLARQMRFRTTPAVRIVGRVSQAMAVGLIRPIVLLPAAWVTELDGEVLEAVIAHELAHLRRWDLPINLAQRLIEVALFFHPVVWWCSRRIRIEREMCCDEAAVAALGSPVQYVRALSHIAQHAGSSYEPAWSAGIGGSRMVLHERIRSLLGVGTVGHGRFYGLSCAAIGAAAASVVWGLVSLSSAPVEVSKNAAPATAAVDREIVQPPPPLHADALTNRFPFGQGVNSDAGLVGKVVNAPTEHNKKVLPSYTIEPPDILFIEAMRVQPKPPHHLQSGDELQIIAEPPEAELAARGFFIDSQGRIDLGPRFGKVQVGKLTADEAAEAVKKTVGQHYPDPTVSLTLVQSQAMQPIAGEHLVAPDGTVNLRSYGSVSVAGKTLKEAKLAIDEHLSQYLDDPQVSVSVFAYNSKVYYVITQGAGEGDAVTRLPITGNETVLDALAITSGLRGLSRKKIFIARPKPGGAQHDKVLPVDWQAITKGASTATNYQVLPGDRIFVVDLAAVIRQVQEDGKADGYSTPY